MRIYRVQERVARKAIFSSWEVGTRRVIWTAIAADRVTPGIASIGVIETKLRVVEDVEGLQAKFNFASLVNREVLNQRHIKVQPTRIIQEISARITKSKAPGGNELVRIEENWAKAARIITGEGSRRSADVRNHIRIRSGANSVSHSGIIQHSDSCAPSIVDNAKRSARLIRSNTAELPPVPENPSPST